MPDGAAGVVIGHDMRPSSPELSPAFAGGVAAHGARRHADRPVLHRRPLLRQRRARPARRDVHREPQPGPVQRHQAVPLGGAAGRPGHRPRRDPRPRPAAARPDAAPARRRRPAGQRSASATCSATTPAFLRGLVDLSGSRPLKVVVDAGNGMGGHTVPAVLGTGGRPARAAARRRAALLRARRHVPQPRGQPARAREPARPAGGRRRARRRHRPGLRRRRRPLLRHRRARRTGEPERRHRPGGRPRDRQAGRSGHAGADVAVVHNVISSAAVPEIVAEQRRPRPVRTRVGHSFIKAEMARDGRRLRRRALARTTTSATSGSPTPACSPRCTCSPPSASRTSRCARSPRRTAAMPPRARSTRRSPTRRPRPRRCARGPGARAPSSTSSTGSPSTHAGRRRPDVVVQPAGLQHRAAAAAQRRGRRP